MEESKGPIAFFDSGIGGFTILKQVRNQLPEYSYIYLGDSARNPYGHRSAGLVYRFTREAVEFLLEKGSPLVVLACNTASAWALRKIQQDYLKKAPQKKVLGVLVPIAEKAVSQTRNKRIGILATEGTVRSKGFEKEIKKLDPEVGVFSKAAPLLVPIVETGEENDDIVETTLRKYIYPLLEKQIDVLVLGCTHYGVLYKKIKNIVGSKVSVISGGEAVAEKLTNYLQWHKKIDNKLEKSNNIYCYTTDFTEKFQNLGNKLLEEKIEVKRCHLKE